MSSGTLLVIGLGNPGGEHEGTRHNAGAEAVERLGRELGARAVRYRGPVRLERATVEGEELLLARPKALYMNESGVAGARLLRDLGLDLSQVVVVYDDLDLQLGRLRVRPSGGTAGHNGLRSLRDHWRSQDFARVRIGIGRPPPGVDPIEHVLSRPRGQERELLRRAVERAGEAVLAIRREGVERAMTEYNRNVPEAAASAG